MLFEHFDNRGALDAPRLADLASISLAVCTSVSTIERRPSRPFDYASFCVMPARLSVKLLGEPAAASIIAITCSISSYMRSERREIGLVEGLQVGGSLNVWLIEGRSPLV